MGATWTGGLQNDLTALSAAYLEARDSHLDRDYQLLATNSITTPNYSQLANIGWTSCRTIQGVSFNGTANITMPTPSVSFPTNCKNCGARLVASKCDYCDTRYN